MSAYRRWNSHQTAFASLSVAQVVACLVAIFLCANSVQAQITLAYSFETLEGEAPDGFGVNGGGTYTQDTIGATHGTNSMKASLIAGGDTFVGAITTLINPTPTGAVIGDPPGIDHVLFDATITEPYTGTFADMGVTIFGCTQDGVCGDKRQFISQVSVDLPVGTHTDLRIDLTSSHETGESFNQTFGEPGSGSDLIPSHFQLFFNKNGNVPLTVYIDNVRIGMTPPVVEGDYNANGTVDAADYTVWRDHFGVTGGATAAEGDGTGDGNVTIEDYTFWKERFGNMAGNGGLSAGAVPEPASALLLAVAGASWVWRRRGRVER